MSFWIELHCDIRAPGMGKDALPACHTQCGDSFGQMTKKTSGIPDTVRDLANEARVRGWHRFRREGWACPFCKTVVKETRIKDSISRRKNTPKSVAYHP